MACKECKETMWPQNPEAGGYHLRLKRYYPPICESCPNQEERLITKLEDRISNLEAISGQPGRIPRQYHDSLTQLQGQVVFLQKELNAALDRGKQKAKQQAAKKQAEKPTYKGLNA